MYRKKRLKKKERKKEQVNEYGLEIFEEFWSLASFRVYNVLLTDTNTIHFHMMANKSMYKYELRVHSSKRIEHFHRFVIQGTAWPYFEQSKLMRNWFFCLNITFYLLFQQIYSTRINNNMITQIRISDSVSNQSLKMNS